MGWSPPLRPRVLKRWRLYRKLPVTVWVREAGPEGELVMTAEGPLMASPGDKIIRGVKGEHYPCKPDIFDQTYEEVRFG